MKHAPLVVHIALSVFLCTACQGDIIYHPERTLMSTPAAIHLEFDDVLFPATDGTMLHGWFIPKENSRATVLFCHGNAGNISHRLKTIEVLHSLGLDVFIFDYRGYGKSEGSPSEQGTYADAEGAWKYLAHSMGIPPERIIVHGRSLGGAIAAYLASKKQARMLVIESSFVSTRVLSRDYCAGFVLLSPLLTYTYPTKEYLNRIRIPVLIMHSRADETIPFSHGEALYQAANEPKEFLELVGGHNTGFMQSIDTYRATLDSFITKHATKQSIGGK
jgi:hypothetical protein